MRADFGETWSANPNVAKDIYTGYIPTGLDNTYSTFVGYSGRHQLATGSGLTPWEPGAAVEYFGCGESDYPDRGPL